jgi:hypothetical protein
MKDKKSKQQPPRAAKSRKYERPVSLWGMTFDEAVARIATAKPKKDEKRRA